MKLAKSFVVVYVRGREKEKKNIPDEVRLKTHKKNNSESCIEIQQQQQQQRKV